MSINSLLKTIRESLILAIYSYSCQNYCWKPPCPESSCKFEKCLLKVLDSNKPSLNHLIRADEHKYKHSSVSLSYSAERICIHCIFINCGRRMYDLKRNYIYLYKHTKKVFTFEHKRRVNPCIANNTKCTHTTSFKF